MRSLAQEKLARWFSNAPSTIQCLLLTGIKLTFDFEMRLLVLEEGGEMDLISQSYVRISVLGAMPRDLASDVCLTS